MKQTPEELEHKIKAARARYDHAHDHAADDGKTIPQNAAARRALRAGTDLVAAVIVGAGMGYGIDRWLGTLPFGMIVLTLLGFVAGFLNIYRAETGQAFKIGFRQDDLDKGE
jgi:ATP synthase protein I